MKPRCPLCNEKSKKLIGDAINPLMLATVQPKSVQKKAARARMCSKKSCKNGRTYTSGVLFCPACKTWDLVSERLEQEGGSFHCLNPNCGFRFSFYY